MKERPRDKWAKENESKPFLGLMASEGGQREESLVEHGCNYFGKGVIRSAPFAPFIRNDVLMLALEMDQWYREHSAIFEAAFHELPYGRNPDGSFKEYQPLEIIISQIYGKIKEQEDGTFCTTRAQRIGTVCVDLVCILRKDRTCLTSCGRAESERVGILDVLMLYRSSDGRKIWMGNGAGLHWCCLER